MLLAALLALCLFLVSGCSAVDEALDRLNEEAAASKLDTPQSASGQTDYSYVLLLREKATQTFLQGFPEAKVTESSVATKENNTNRVIVTLTYEMNGKSGTYGFDYRKNDAGEYDLERYGDGVDSDDL